MKPSLDYEIEKENILYDLKEIEFISSFIMYDKFNLSKKKLRRQLKKIIKHIENDKLEKYLINMEDFNE